MSNKAKREMFPDSRLSRPVCADMHMHPRMGPFQVDPLPQQKPVFRSLPGTDWLELVAQRLGLDRIFLEEKVR